MSNSLLNIVVPMAGRGSRFRNAGYFLPKPLIPVHGKHMIHVVIENLRPVRPHRFIFICLKEHLEQFQLAQFLSHWSPGCVILSVDDVTEGAACTVLLAKDYINNSDPLMIANCDQWIDIDINNYLTAMNQANVDGYIMTMWANDPKWSYVRLNESNSVCELVEKEVVSNEATTGIYNYRCGSDFVKSAESMVAKNFRVNNEFYVAPAYNEMLLRGQTVGFYNIGKEGNGMYGLGTPDDLEKFIQHFTDFRLSKV